MSTMDYLEFKNYLEHSFTQKDKAEYYKNKDMNSIKRARYTDNKKAYLDFAKDVNEIDALIKDYESKSAKGANTSTLSKMSNQIIDRIKKNESKFGYPPVYLVDWAMKHGAKDSDFMYPIPHDNFKGEHLSHASIAGAPSRLRSKMQSAIYKKTGYQSKGSYAGAPNTAKQATADQNKAVANARFSANIKSAIEACNRDAAEAQSVYVEATTRINNIVSRNHGEVNSIIRSVNEYNENVRNVRKQTFTRKSTFGTVANGKLYQGVREEEIAADPNRQFISFSAGAQKISANKYVYKPKMLLIDSDPGTYKEV